MALFVGDSFVIVLCCAIGVFAYPFLHFVLAKMETVALGKANTPLVIKAAYRVYLDLNL